MRVLVTGASGALGPAVVSAFCNDGHRVRVLSRRAPEAPLWPKDVEVYLGSLADTATVDAAVKQVDVIIHLAALLHVANPPAALEEAHQQINVGGTAAVVEAAQAAGVERIVFSSTISVYGRGDGRALTEDVPPRPDSFYARTKLDAEAFILRARRHGDGHPIGTVLRLAAVYGARVKGNYRRLVRALARGWFIPIGDGRNLRTLVYERDVARAVLLAARHPRAAGRVYNVSDGRVHPVSEVLAAICEALGRRPPRGSVPIIIARGVAGALEDGAGLIGRRCPIGRATVDKYTEDIAADSQRIQSELGFVPEFGLTAGWRETIRDMRQMGVL